MKYLARANSFIIKSNVKKIKTFNPQPYVRWLFLLQVVYRPNDAKYNRCQKLDKIRDMEELVAWYANALSPNEGFAGVSNPDYLGFHHNSYYASAYTPHAIHCGALIAFLLSGTPFSLSKNELLTRESKVGTKKRATAYLPLCKTDVTPNLLLVDRYWGGVGVQFL